MAQRKLQLNRRLSVKLGIATWASSLLGCAHAEPSLGMTLLFLNMGPYSIGVRRFDPDGKRGPVPGALGSDAKLLTPERGGGKQMSFMPGDSKRGVPEFVEIQWTGSAEGLDSWWAENITNRTDKYSPKWNEDYKKAIARLPRFTKRIDLTSILTPELLAQVRANPNTTNLKLTIVFKGEDVTITAAPEVWRK